MGVVDQTGLKKFVIFSFFLGFLADLADEGVVAADDGFAFFCSHTDRHKDGGVSISPRVLSF